MSTHSNTEHPSILKRQRLQEILCLLQDHGPMGVKAIAAAMPHISVHSVNHYLDELLLSRNIHKVHPPGKSKRARIFAFQNALGSKTDMVSTALSNPLHQVMSAMVMKSKH